jgi:PAS domain S-box-containing protein
MRTTRKRSEYVDLGIALVILLGVAALAYRSVDAAGETLGWVERAGRVLHEMDVTTSAFARATAARRSYLVAGDASALADTEELDAKLEKALVLLRSAVSDRAVQAGRVEALSALYHERLESLDAAVARRRRGELWADTVDSLTLTARIRELRDAIEKEENTLLEERDAQTRRGISATKVAEVAGTLVSFAILLLTFRRLSQEIARRRETEVALRSNELFLDSIVENIPDMIFVKEARELRFQRINRAGEELIGLSRSDLLGKNDYDFFPKAQAETFQAKDRETLTKGAIVDVAEEPIQTKAGERWLHTKKVPVADESGVPQYLLGISEDITVRREDAASLKAAKDAAEAANRELESFSYSVAHDLRAPLRAIDGFSRALLEDCGDRLDDDGRDHLTRVCAATRQMGELIDGLLGLSRLSRGEIVREPIDLTKLAEDISERLRSTHPDREVDVVVEPGLTVEGDGRLLRAAVENLLGNAWKFTGKRAGARVEVGRTTVDGKTTFFVKDNGAGFDQAYVHKLFGAFQRLHGASEFDGSGIGLATVHRIVRRHGGSVWAEGEIDRGATFYFTL